MSEADTTIPVRRENATWKDMSQRQVLANVEPGDLVWGHPRGGPRLRLGKVTRIRPDGREIEAKDTGGRTFWLTPGDITRVALRHPERGT